MEDTGLEWAKGAAHTAHTAHTARTAVSLQGIVSSLTADTEIVMSVSNNER